MTSQMIFQLVILLAAIAIGARAGGVGMGLWGGVGLLIVVFVTRAAPGSIPGEVLLIILTVIMAASAMEAAGGIDYLVKIAAGLIRKSPRHVTIIAPLVSYVFTFLSGTGHIFYPLIPVIYEVAMKGRVRPERPIAVSTIASQQAITASPVSAATAAMIALLGAKGVGLVQILLICVPSTLIGVLVAALVQTRIGVELDQDPEYQRRLASGELTPPTETDTAALEGKNSASNRGGALSAWMFLVAVFLVVCCGLFPNLRKVGTEAAPVTVSMPMTIAIVMMGVAAAMLLFTRTSATTLVKTKTCQAGITAVIGILGLAWLGDTFIDDNSKVIIGGLSHMAESYPASFALGLFVTSMLLYSQAATTQTLMPLGLTLGIAPAALAGMFPAVNGYFFIPTYGTLIAAVNFDRSGTTRIGKYVLNHSFMIPGLVSTLVAVSTGLLIAKIFF
ncbi:MAG: anaerobic C4-dicarboxylate transporter [Candidatus Sumerlaeaceae bacterium]|nr:anaerobic C4-dicarboxylate transporter [Candidatus Sumerlaeaceae bacterium]